MELGFKNPQEDLTEEVPVKQAPSFWCARTLITLTPVILVVTIGVSHRIAPDESFAPEYGPKYHQIVNDYVNPVQKTYESLTKFGTIQNREKFDEVSDLWISSKRDGILGEIPPIYSGDDSRKGVKAEILECKHKVAAIEFLLFQNEKVPNLKFKHATRSLEIEKIGSEFDVASNLSTIRFENQVLIKVIEHEAIQPGTLSLETIQKWLVEYDDAFALATLKKLLDSELECQVETSTDRTLDSQRIRLLKILDSKDPLTGLKYSLEHCSLEMGSTIAILRQAILELKSRKQLLTALRTLRDKS